MRIVYCGSSAFGLPCLDALEKSKHQLVHIITQPSRVAGRGKKLRITPVANWAKNHGVACRETENLNSPDMLEFVANLNADIFVVIAFGQKVSPEFINLAKYKAINVHGSLLPLYRGAAPINRAIIDGQTKTGVTVITLAQRMDAGEMLGKAEIDIAPSDTASVVHDKLSEISAPLVIDTLEKIESGTVIYQPQDEAMVTIAPKLKKSDGYIDFAQSGEKIVNLIRGMWSWPGAQCEYLSVANGKKTRVTIARANVVDIVSQGNLSPGCFDDNMNIVCGDSAIKIEEIKPAGSSLMDFKSFLNGRRASKDDKFLSIDSGL